MIQRSTIADESRCDAENSTGYGNTCITPELTIVEPTADVYQINNNPNPVSSDRNDTILPLCGEVVPSGDGSPPLPASSGDTLFGTEKPIAPPVIAIAGGARGEGDAWA